MTISRHILPRYTFSLYCRVFRFSLLYLRTCTYADCPLLFSHHWLGAADVLLALVNPVDSTWLSQRTLSWIVYSKGLLIFILVLLDSGVLILVLGHLWSFHKPCHVPRVEKTLRKRLFCWLFSWFVPFEFGSSLLLDLLFIFTSYNSRFADEVTWQLDSVCT